MLIRTGYDIQFDVPSPVAIVAMLHAHPSVAHRFREPDTLSVSPDLPVEQYLDAFGNICSRIYAPAGNLTLRSSGLVEDSGEPDLTNPDAREHPVHELPASVLQFLLPSRYCEVDLMLNIATDLFGNAEPGWSRVQSICDWVNSKVVFGYHFARSTKTALDVYTERTGVCRDFQHLAITLCRCMNIPARYATGYLGDIGVPPAPCPMDFSAWFEVFLDNRWWALDARHNRRRIGRILMATGRDAADVAITTSFGTAKLTKFEVVTEEVPEYQPA